MSGTNIVGIVEEVMDNGKAKGSGLRINGLKYGIYDPADAGLDEVSVGTTVSLRFKETEKSGITYRNVQGKVTTVKDGTAVNAPAASAVSAGSGGGKGGYRKNGEEGGFPIHPKAYERALDRRNALQCAVNYVQYDADSAISVDDVLRIARKFEAYTTGDDVAQAEAKLAFTNDSIDE